MPEWYAIVLLYCGIVADTRHPLHAGKIQMTHHQCVTEAVAHYKAALPCVPDADGNGHVTGPEYIQWLGCRDNES